MRFIKAFPGSDNGCCAEMTRANVCDPCCADTGCTDPPLTIAIDGYTDGMFGSSDACEILGCPPKENFGCPIPWDGILDLSPLLFAPCQWILTQMPCPGEPELAAEETYDGVVLEVGACYVNRTVDLESCQSFYTFVLACAQTPSGDCMIFSDVKVAAIGSVDDTPLGTYEGGTIFVEP